MIKWALERCPDKAAYMVFRVRAVKIEQENNDDNLSSCLVKSSDMRSIDSNPRSDLDFEDFNTDVKESDVDGISISNLPKLQKKTPWNDNSATRPLTTTHKGHLRKINRNNSM